MRRLVASGALSRTPGAQLEQPGWTRPARMAGDVTCRGERTVLRTPGAQLDTTEKPGWRSQLLCRAMKRYHVTTFGCQMNEHDSERMKGMLRVARIQRGAAARGGRSDPVQHVLDPRDGGQPLPRASRRSETAEARTPERIVGVGGCWAQSVKEEVFERFPFVDVAFGPGAGAQARGVPHQRLADARRATSSSRASRDTCRRTARAPFQGWMQISVGCNCACSYCIVPSTRGREVSRPLDELVAEAQAMAADGVREVTLLGQNVNSYGRDLPPHGERATFAALLAEIDAIEGIERIRYTSPHPKDMREDVVRAHAELASVCEHIHLPLQSGSSRILKAMRRTYDRRALPGARRDDPRARPGRRADDGHHRRLPGGDRGGLRADARSRGAGLATTARSLSSSHRDVARRRRRSPRAWFRTRSRSSAWSACWRSSSAERASARQRFVGRTLDVLVEGSSRTDAERLRGRTRHNKASTSRGWPRRASSRRCGSTRRRVRRSRARSCCSRASAAERAQAKAGTPASAERWPRLLRGRPGHGRCAWRDRAPRRPS